MADLSMILAGRRFMYGLAYRLTGGNHADAADLAQEALIRAWRNLDAFDGRNPRGWITTVMRNIVLNKARDAGRRGVHCSLDDVGDIPMGGDPERAAMAKEGLRAVLSLPEDRRILVLAAAAGTKGEVIAGRLGIEVATVRSRLARTRARLAEQHA